MLTCSFVSSSFTCGGCALIASVGFSSSIASSVTSSTTKIKKKLLRNFIPHGTGYTCKSGLPDISLSPSFSSVSLSGSLFETSCSFSVSKYHNEKLQIIKLNQLFTEMFQIWKVHCKVQKFVMKFTIKPVCKVSI